MRFCQNCNDGLVRSWCRQNGCLGKRMAKIEREAANDLREAMAALADFEKNGGTSLESLKREMLH